MDVTQVFAQGLLEDAEGSIDVGEGLGLPGGPDGQIHHLPGQGKHEQQDPHGDDQLGEGERPSPC